MLKLKILKAAVFVMTFLIVFGLLFIVGRLAGAFGKTATARKQPPQTISLGEEAGSRIKQITADGKYLYLLTTDDKTADKIIIFDTEKFRRVSAININ